MERWLDLDEGLHWLSHHLRPFAAVLAVLLFAGWGLSGVTQVGPGEVALVRRCGRLLPDDLGPGLHWRWPWPVEDVTRVKPGQIRTLEIGFRSEGAAAGQLGPRAWSSQHGGDGIRRLADEAVVITGDGNLLEVQATVRYAIAEPRVFLFEVSDPLAVVRSATEAVLREVAGGRSFAELLTTERASFHAAALAGLQERCAEYGPRGLGLRIEGLALHDLHPPQEVVEAYHEVSKAMETRDRRVNLAAAAALARERVQQGDSLRLKRQAAAEAEAKVLLAEAHRDAFHARQASRTQLSLAEEASLLLDAVNDLAAGRSPETTARDYRRRRAEAQARQAQVNDFRLYWDALAAALTGREKVVVDADKVPGRRHLWLVPLDWLRGPAPLPAMPERDRRGAPRRGEGEEP
jgi:regulator of protease activity HflC (stomatin/prohibitin superfamily)